jgi:hypothetical protein
MPEDKTALLAHYRAMRAALTAAIDGLSEAALAEETLDGWSVKDHLAHIALWDEIRAAEVIRISAGFDSAWRMAPEHEGPFGDIAYELRRDLTPAQALWESATTHERLLEAITRATERGLDGSRYGEAGLLSTHEAAHTGWILRWRKERGL